MRMLSLHVLLFLVLIQNVHGQTLYPTSTGVVGAVYTMSNGANLNNQIIVHTLNASGLLTMVKMVGTNGSGVNTTSGDPLFSQGSLVAYWNYLFAVNAGSNTLSMFMISPSDATQLTLLSVQSVNGIYPVSVAVNAMYACVLTGGPVTGIRCFTYNSSGLFLMSSFDRNLTSYVSQSNPPVGPAQTVSEILFSADNLALIISIKGFNATSPGCLLFYTFTSGNMMLSTNATQMMPTGGVLPFSMTLVGNNGLLITDPGAGGVLTMNYSSTTGMISNSMLTLVNTTLAAALCWSTYSPNIGNYYVIGAGTATIVELTLNLTSMSSPVQIIQYYMLPNNTGALEAIVVSMAGKDYLYVLGTTAHVITGYKLSAAGSAMAIGMVTSQLGDVSGIPKLAGIAAFIQTRSSSTSSTSSPSSGVSDVMPTFTFTIMMIIFILINRE